MTFSYHDWPFLITYAGEYMFLSDVFHISYVRSFTSMSFNLVLESVIETLLNPLKEPFLNGNPRHFVFLSCIFQFSTIMAFIHVNFSFILQSVNIGLCCDYSLFMTFSYPDWPFLTTYAGEYLFLSDVFHMSYVRSFTSMSFNLVLESVIETLLNPLKEPFLNGNPRHFVFLSCIFQFSTIMAFIHVNFSFVLQSVNKGLFLGGFGGLPPLNPRNDELKKWVFIIPIVVAADQHYQTFRSQKCK